MDSSTKGKSGSQDVSLFLYIHDYSRFIRLVPALAIGFDDVQKRLDMQSKLSEAHSEKLKELEQVLTKIQTSCLTATISKLDECKQRHMELAQRLVKVNVSSPKDGTS